MLGFAPLASAPLADDGTVVVIVTPRSGSVVYYISADATNISVASNGSSAVFEAYVS